MNAHQPSNGQNRVWQIVALVIVCAMIGLGLTNAPRPVQAQEATPTLPTTPTATPAKQTWKAGTTLQIAPGVPFVWLRTIPRPDSPVRATVMPGTALIVQAVVEPSVDQYNQVWWLVSAPSLGRVGWVEQTSLMLALATSTPGVTLTSTAILIRPPGTPTASASLAARPPAMTWVIPNVLFVKSSVAYISLRATPSPTGNVLDTLQLGGLVIVRGAAYWDGGQWWWPVQSAYSGVIGWVEQNAVERAEYKTPTPSG